MASSLTEDDELIELAAVVRAHGLRGELGLKSFNPDSELLRELQEVVLKLGEQAPRRYKLRGARGHSDQLLLSLEGVNDRNAAEALRGALICVPRSALPEPGEDEYYLVDLVGLEARDPAGKVLGKVEDIIQYPSVACLQVTGKLGSWEVPDTDRYVREIDLEAGFVVVDNIEELEVLHTPAGEGSS